MLRLTVPLTVLVILLVLLMGVMGKLLPLAQIIPVVTYNNPTILLVDANRHMAAALRSNPSVVFNAVVSPDQQHLAFSMSDRRKIHIFVGNLYDHDYHQLTTESMGGDNPAWSPDGNQIAFVGLEPDNKRGIYTAAAQADSPMQTIVKAGIYASPAWSADGHDLIFAASQYQDLPDLFVVDADCRLRCDRELLPITNELVVDTIPVWSPDGSKIAFLSDRSGDYEIYMLDMNCMQAGQQKCSSQIPRRLRLKHPIVPFLILWSLDGDAVYFRGRDGISNQPGLYAVRSNCYTLPEGCQPHIIYNLMTLLHGKRG